METLTQQVQRAFRERPHMQCGAAAAWFTHPAGVVFQLVEPARMTLQLSRFLVDDVFMEAVRRFPECRALNFVLDFSLMSGRTAASRSLLLSRMRASADRCGQIYLSFPPNVAPALKRSFQASMQLAAELGVETRLVGSVRQAVASGALVCAP